MSSWVDSILLKAEVVHCIVYAEDLVKVNLIVLDIDAVPISIGEVMFIAIISEATCAGKDMILKSREKILSD